MSLKKLNDPLKIPSEKHRKLVPSDIIEDAPYDPERPRHKDLILKIADESVQVVELDKRLQLKKWCCFIICIGSNVAGVLLTLLGLAATVLFHNYQNNTTVFWCSFIFYVPTFIYLRILCFPGRDEARIRKYIVNWRDWRKSVAREQKRVFLGRAEEHEEEEHIKSSFKIARHKHTTSVSGISGTMRGDSFRNSVNISAGESKKKSSFQQGAGGGGSTPGKGGAPTSILVGSSSKRSSFEMPDKSQKKISFMV